MSARAAAVLVAVAAVAAAAGCRDRDALPGIDWQQMIAQPSLRPYEASELFSDGRAMRSPPLGTVPRDEPFGDPALLEGEVDGRPVEELPVPLTRELLERGRWLFETYCATCHGAEGDGRSAVAENMEFRKPPSLVTAPVTGMPPGRIYRVATYGYAFMPAYRAELDVVERWAVVAYLRALQLRREVRFAELPPELRDEARRALEGAR